MLVSVLIPNYNYARFLPEAIESVLLQTYPSVETIVVDDGSTDNSRDLIGAYADRLISIYQPNRGQTSALNAAFERSSGDLICLLDADDIFESEKVARVVAAAQRVPSAHLIHHQMQTVDENGVAMHAPFPACVPDGDVRALVTRTGGWFPHPIMSGLSFTREYAQALVTSTRKATLRRARPVPCPERLRRHLPCWSRRACCTGGRHPSPVEPLPGSSEQRYF